MCANFFDISKQIANDYLQSIVFLDDKAYSNSVLGNNQHDFDAYEITMFFAKEKKICAVYSPKIEDDINSFCEMAIKADVIVLDWQILLKDANNGAEDLEADVEVNDPRGQYTKTIIKEIIETAGDSCHKLIVIYTGEDIYDLITEDIYNDVHHLNSSLKFKKAECEISSTNIRILVRGKYYENIDTKFEHRQHLKDMVIKYEELPSFILKSFTDMTLGLLPNFALSSLTTIRRNSSKILGLFSKESDPAYLAHKALLPHSEDAEQMLHHLFKDSIGELLSYHNVGNQALSKDIISKWIEEYIIVENHSIRSKKGIELNPQISYNRDQNLLKSLLFHNQANVEKKYLQLFKSIADDKDVVLDYLSFLSRNSTMLFLNNDVQINEEKCNKKFAKLTHHKSLFRPLRLCPILTLGTIIKRDSKYFVCIQQKCDSVRLKNGKERKFLFLPLSISTDAQFHIVTDDDIKLRLDKKSYSIKTIKFKGNSNKAVVESTLSENKFIFTSSYNEEYEWVLDLKEMHSQRILTEFAAKLSRIGLDESEWLRRANKTDNN